MIVFEAFCRTVGELCCNVFEKVAVLKLQLWGLVFEWRVDSMGPMVDFSNMFACLVFFYQDWKKELGCMVGKGGVGGGGGSSCCWWWWWTMVVEVAGGGGGSW